MYKVKLPNPVDFIVIKDINLKCSGKKNINLSKISALFTQKAISLMFLNI